jgi:hypothetical protein
MIDKSDLENAIDLLEAAYPDSSVSFSVISNDRHAITPFGKGVSVQIWHGAATVYEKSHTFQAAMVRALERLRRRLAGDDGA